MFDKEARAERKRIKEITPAHKLKYKNVGNTKTDRIRTAIVLGGGVLIIGLATSKAIDLVSRDDNPPATTPGQERDPISLTNGIPCDVSNMENDALQTGYLQEFLQEQGFYEGPIDQKYDFDVIRAVTAFQLKAHSQDQYNQPVDGRAGPYTCEAMVAAGDEHFIVD